MNQTIFNDFKTRILNGEVDSAFSGYSYPLNSTFFDQYLKNTDISIEQFRTISDLTKYASANDLESFSDCLFSGDYYGLHLSNYYESNLTTKPIFVNSSNWDEFTAAYWTELSGGTGDVSARLLSYLDPTTQETYEYSEIEDCIDANSGFYYVRTKEELAWLAENRCNAETGYNTKIKIVLGDDIGLESDSYDKLTLTICPSASRPFQGVLDFNGHKITNKIIWASGNSNGIIGYLGREGVVRNGILSNFTISAYNNKISLTKIADDCSDVFVGGLVGTNYGTVENMQISGLFNFEGFCPEVYLVNNRQEYVEGANYVDSDTRMFFPSKFCINSMYNVIPYVGYFAEGADSWFSDLGDPMLDFIYRDPEYSIYPNALPSGYLGTTSAWMIAQAMYRGGYYSHYFNRGGSVCDFSIVPDSLYLEPRAAISNVLDLTNVRRYPSAPLDSESDSQYRRIFGDLKCYDRSSPSIWGEYKDLDMDRLYCETMNGVSSVTSYDSEYEFEMVETSSSSGGVYSKWKDLDRGAYLLRQMRDIVHLYYVRPDRSVSGQSLVHEKLTPHQRLDPESRIAYFCSPLVGCNHGTIQCCEASMTILESSGTFVGFIGNLCGKLNGGTIQHCSARLSVSGNANRSCDTRIYADNRELLNSNDESEKYNSRVLFGYNWDYWQNPNRVGVSAWSAHSADLTVSDELYQISSFPGSGLSLNHYFLLPVLGSGTYQSYETTYDYADSVVDILLEIYEAIRLSSYSDYRRLNRDYGHDGFQEIQAIESDFPHGETSACSTACLPELSAGIKMNCSGIIVDISGCVAGKKSWPTYTSDGYISGYNPSDTTNVGEIAVGLGYVAGAQFAETSVTGSSAKLSAFMWGQPWGVKIYSDHCTREELFFDRGTSAEDLNWPYSNKEESFMYLGIIDRPLLQKTQSGEETINDLTAINYSAQYLFSSLMPSALNSLKIKHISVEYLGDSYKTVYLEDSPEDILNTITYSSGSAYDDDSNYYSWDSGTYDITVSDVYNYCPYFKNTYSAAINFAKNLEYAKIIMGTNVLGDHYCFPSEKSPWPMPYTVSAKSFGTVYHDYNDLFECQPYLCINSGVSDVLFDSATFISMKENGEDPNVGSNWVIPANTGPNVTSADWYCFSDQDVGFAMSWYGSPVSGTRITKSDGIADTVVPSARIYTCDYGDTAFKSSFSDLTLAYVTANQYARDPNFFCSVRGDSRWDIQSPLIYSAADVSAEPQPSPAESMVTISFMQDYSGSSAILRELISYIGAFSNVFFGSESGSSAFEDVYYKVTAGKARIIPDKMYIPVLHGTQLSAFYSNLDEYTSGDKTIYQNLFPEFTYISAIRYCIEEDFPEETRTDYYAGRKLTNLFFRGAGLGQMCIGQEIDTEWSSSTREITATSMYGSSSSTSAYSVGMKNVATEEDAGFFKYPANVSRAYLDFHILTDTDTSGEYENHTLTLSIPLYYLYLPISVWKFDFSDLSGSVLSGEYSEDFLNLAGEDFNITGYDYDDGIYLYPTPYKYVEENYSLYYADSAITTDFTNSVPFSDIMGRSYIPVDSSDGLTLGSSGYNMGMCMRKRAYYYPIMAAYLSTDVDETVEFQLKSIYNIGGICGMINNSTNRFNYASALDTSAVCGKIIDCSVSVADETLYFIKGLTRCSIANSTSSEYSLCLSDSNSATMGLACKVGGIAAIYEYHANEMGLSCYPGIWNDSSANAYTNSLENLSNGKTVISGFYLSVGSLKELSGINRFIWSPGIQWANLSLIQDYSNFFMQRFWLENRDDDYEDSVGYISHASTNYPDTLILPYWSSNLSERSTRGVDSEPMSIWSWPMVSPLTTNSGSVPTSSTIRSSLLQFAGDDIKDTDSYSWKNGRWISSLNTKNMHYLFNNALSISDFWMFDEEESSGRCVSAHWIQTSPMCDSPNSDRWQLDGQLFNGSPSVAFSRFTKAVAANTLIYCENYLSESEASANGYSTKLSASLSSRTVSGLPEHYRTYWDYEYSALENSGCFDLSFLYLSGTLWLRQRGLYDEEERLQYPIGSGDYVNDGGRLQIGYLPRSSGYASILATSGSLDGIAVSGEEFRGFLVTDVNQNLICLYDVGYGMDLDYNYYFLEMPESAVVDSLAYGSMAKFSASEDVEI